MKRNRKACIVWVVVIVLLVDVIHAGAASGNLYKTLGVSKECSPSELKKAYRKQCLKYHPDKVPPEERAKAETKFKEINEAYDTLSDENKRSLYDEYGEAGLQPNFQPGFSGAFNNPSGFSGPQYGQDGSFQFFGSDGGSAGGFGSVDLRDILRDLAGQQGNKAGFSSKSSGGFGAKSPFGSSGNVGGMDFGDILRDIFGGRGGPQGNAAGSPFSSTMPEQGFGRQRQRRPPKSYKREFSCSLEELAKGCTKKLRVKHPIKSSRYTDEVQMQSKIYKIDITPGWKSGTKIKFPAKDGFPAMNFVLTEKKHSFLERRGNDLVYRCKISPKQAEKGARITIPMPDGEQLSVVTKDEVPTHDGHKMTIQDKGMPIKGGQQRGNLIIEFHVVPQTTAAA